MNFYRLLIGMLLAASAIAVSSCKLNRKSIKASDSEDAKSLVHLDTVAFTRSASQRSGTLVFKTKLAVHCSIKYWQRDNANNPLEKACNNTDGRTEVEETLEPLQSDALYTLRVYIWLPNLPPESAKTFLVDEGGEAKDYVVDELIVARSNIPLQSVEVYRHLLETPASISSLQGKMAPDLGCKAEELAWPQPFERAEEQSNVNFLSTQGFASGSAKTHPEFTNRLLLAHDKPQPEVNWEWAYEWKSTPFEFVSKPPTLISKLIMVLGEEVRFSEKNLMTLPKTFTMPKTGSIDVKWETKFPSVTSFLMLLFKSKSGQAVTCVFPGNDGQGQIPAEIVKQMPADEYDFTGSLIATQFHIRDNSTAPAWVVTSHDWRFAKLVKP